MLKSNLNHNDNVKPNTDFLNELREKLPTFFTADKFDAKGKLVEEGSFDLEKFQRALKESNINELTSGYQLDFIGKDYAKKQAGEYAKTVIVPDKTHNQLDENKNSKNLFFTGDNLEVLRHLQNNYSNSVDMIYIDPPYNTGSDGFIYPDNFEYSDQALKDMFGMTDEGLQRLKSIQGKATHSAWLTFMYPRLWMAKRLLSDEGVIFISIDDNEQANIKMLCDEMFGEGNFIAQIVRNTNSSKNQSKFVSVSHEYALIYAKNKETLSEKHKEKKWAVDKNNVDEYLKKIKFLKDKGLSDGEITEELKELTKYPRFTDFTNYWYIDDRGVYRKGDMGGVANGLNMPIFNPLTQKNDPIPPGGFRFKEETLKELIDNDRIHFHTDGSLPTVKRYLLDGLKQRPKSIMSDDQRPDVKFLSDIGVPFDNPKQLAFMERIFSIVDEDSIILDFFAGSATSAHAVMKLNALDGGNRQYIMVQLPEKTYSLNDDGEKIPKKGSKSAFKADYFSIDEISRERIKQASKKIQDENGLKLPENFDGGFKHYYVVSPDEPTLDDIESFDIETGLFKDSKGQLTQLPENAFYNMLDPFSAKGLNVKGNASGEETIITTWVASDGYKMDTEIISIDFNDYQANYVDNSRLYLVQANWRTEQTRELLNRIGTNELSVQNIILYAYVFDLESIREIEIGLKQLNNKVNLIKRY
ncbi:DNA methyltransferase [Priestia megaterium]|uniref:site-specific DNA-methyltransferase n=1 Tax=Priestia megaterium TaxID=1404 RepID=UPI0039A18639